MVENTLNLDTSNLVFADLLRLLETSCHLTLRISNIQNPRLKANTLPLSFPQPHISPHSPDRGGDGGGQAAFARVDDPQQEVAKEGMPIIFTEKDVCAVYDHTTQGEKSSGRE